MSNSQQRIIANIELAIGYGDLTVSLLQQAKEASFVTRIPLLLSSLATYALHLLYVDAARFAQTGTLCTLTRPLGFVVQTAQVILGPWDVNSIVDTFEVIDPATVQGAESLLTDGYIIGYINNGTQLARMCVSHLALLDLSDSCTNQVRTMVNSRNIPNVSLPAAIGGPITTGNCLTVISEANARSQPAPEGRNIGGVHPEQHTDLYDYYFTQGDKLGADYTWYQTTPLGYGPKGGYGLWIRNNPNLTSETRLNLGVNCPGPILLQQLGASVSNDSVTLPQVEQGVFGNFNDDEDILTFILAVESGYDITVAQDIAYVFRARMISDKFHDKLFEVMREYGIIQVNNVPTKSYQWSAWADQANLSQYNNALSDLVKTAVISHIRDVIVPALIHLPDGGLGALPFSASNPALEYALFTAGNQLYSGNEITDYFNNNIKLPVATIVSNIRAEGWLSAAQLGYIYIDHTLSENDPGFTTVFFSEWYKS